MVSIGIVELEIMKLKKMSRTLSGIAFIASTVVVFAAIVAGWLWMFIR